MPSQASMQADLSVRSSTETSTVSGGPGARRSCHTCTGKYQARHAKPQGGKLPRRAPESPAAEDSASAAPQATDSDVTAQQATDSDVTAQQAADFDGTAQQAAEFTGDALHAAGSAGFGMGMDECSQLPLSVMPTQGPHAAWLPGGGEGEADWGTPAAAAGAAPRRRARAQLSEGFEFQPDAAPGARRGRLMRPRQTIEEELLHMCGDGAFDSRAQHGFGAGAPQVASPEHAMAPLGHRQGMEGILDSWDSMFGDGDGAAARFAGGYGGVSMGGGGRAGAAPPAFELHTVSATLTKASRAAGYHTGARAAQPGYAWPPPMEEAVDSAGGHDSAWAPQPASPWQDALGAPDPAQGLVGGMEGTSVAQPGGMWLGGGPGAPAAWPISGAGDLEPAGSRNGLIGGAAGMATTLRAASLPVSAPPPDIHLHRMDPGEDMFSIWKS